MLPDLQLASPLPAIAHLDQWGGVWAIEERHARQLISRVKTLNLAVHVAAHQDEVAENAKAVDFHTVETGGERVIAVVEISGTMTKFGSSMSSQGSTLRARREIRKAAGDSRVTGILLKLDSPGGSVSGTPDLARDVAEAAKQKPVYAYAEDLCCSAAYYVASQATKVYANENAIVGSIGVYFVIDDFSKLYEETGITAHVVKFGAHKGDGVEGTPITDEMLAGWQEEVDTLGEQFVAAVAKGRGLSKAAAGKLADGRVWIGQAAVDAKLIDGVQTLDKTLQQLAKAKPGSGAKAEATNDPLLTLAAEADDSEPLTLNPNPTLDPTPEPTEETKSKSKSKSKKETLSTDLEEPHMATKPAETETPQAATYSEIAAGCKGFNEDSGDDAKFAASCLKRNLTLEAAKDEWNETLAARLEAREQELAAAKEAAAKSPTSAKPAGNAPLDDGDGDTKKASAGDPIATWNGLLKGYEEQGYAKADAVRLGVAENPEAHQAYLAAYAAEAKKGKRPALRK